MAVVNQNVAPAGGSPEKPAVRGVTVAEREARSANERDLSPKNESIMPTLADIGAYLPSARSVIPKAGNKKPAPNPDEPNPDEPNPDEPNPDEPNPDEPNPDEPNPDEPNPDEPNPDEPNPDEPNPDELNPDELNPDEPNPDELNPDEPNPDEPNPDEPKGWPKSAQQRVNELTRKNHEAREQTALLEAEVTQLRERVGAAPVRLAPTATDPLADVTSEADLQAAVEHAQRIEQWAIEHPEGGDVVTDQKTGATEYVSAEVVRGHLAAARRTLNAAQNRRAWIADHSKATAFARQQYPNMFKAGTDEAAIYDNTLKQFPEIMRMPAFALIIGDAIEGQKARVAAQAAAKKPAASKAPVPVRKPQVAPINPHQAPRVPKAVIKKSTAVANLIKSAGSKKGLQNFAESIIS